jgi:serine/threonine protein kinase
MSSRVDAWEVNKHKEYKPVKCGYADGFFEKYELGEQLGKGGFGIVRVVTHRQSGKQYAAKSIKKLLQVPNLPIQRQAAHLANIKREVSVLYRLRGTLNVVGQLACAPDVHVHQLGRGWYPQIVQEPSSVLLRSFAPYHLQISLLHPASAFSTTEPSVSMILC